MRKVVGAVIAVQVLLPTGMLAVRWAEQGSRPQSELPASWQMYSSVPSPTYIGVDPGGRERRLDVEPLPPVVRDVDTGRVVPDRLCARHPDLTAVRIKPGRLLC